MIQVCTGRSAARVERGARISWGRGLTVCLADFVGKVSDREAVSFLEEEGDFQFMADHHCR